MTVPFSAGVAVTHPTDGTETAGRPPLRCWPLDRRALFALVAAWAVGVGLFTGLGFLLVELLEGSGLGDREVALSRWFEDHRTPTLDTWSTWGSMTADTVVKLITVPAVVVVLVASTRRWHDGALLLTTMILEVSVFGLTTILVGRERPPVEQLDGSLPTNSFPSGHVAASTAFWMTLALIVAWHTRSIWWRALAGVAAVVVPVVVALSRLYRGMHFLSDVLAGVVLGLACVACTTLIVRLAVQRMVRRSAERVPDHARQLALTSRGDER